MTRIDLQLHRPSGALRTFEPVTVGLPFPRGLSYETTDWALSSEAGTPRPLQTRVLDRWPDGSIRWGLLDFQVSTGLSASPTAALLIGKEPAMLPIPSRSLSVHERSGGIDISTGVVRFRLSNLTPLFFEEVVAGTQRLVDPSLSGLRIAPAEGDVCAVRWQRPTIEERGALRTTVRIDGEVCQGRALRLGVIARLHFYAGLPVVRLLLTIRNPHRAAHPGGFWELGDPGSFFIRDLSLVLHRAAEWQPKRARISVEPTKEPETARQRIEIYQDSSGGANWMGANHVNRHGRVPNRFRGYRADVDSAIFEGLRATPIVLMEDDVTIVGAAVPAFWQNFPRAVTADLDELVIGFFPKQYADVHELQGGEQKTHECYLLFGPDPVSATPFDWCRSRVVASADPEWYASSKAVPYLAPAATDPHGDYKDLVNAAIDGPESFVCKRERIDEYGWRHFGEIYADHEAVFHKGPAPLVSHYNNQYDPVAGFAYQFMRTGDPRWWTQCRELAAHVIDIDIYHTAEDKSAYNGGLFWHSAHYVDAGRSSHRSYPRAKGSNGGGPASEHNYTTGLMLHSFLTGDPASREAALGLAEFVINIDDGAKTVFRWLDRGQTGLASASRTPLYHGPGRGSGNSLNALVDGHRLSGERKFLDKADQIIRRCVHPDDAIDGMSLLDAENRWFYTMCLQSLGKYLDHKAELGELDAMYAYARASLLHYARWMAGNEYPYLEKPEILEYPTETWAAQDMRKSEVFTFAVKHADEEERAQFRERADFFFHYSTSTLKTMPTRGLTRPLVLLLAHGFMHAYFAHHPHTTAPGTQGSGAQRFAERTEAFVPQKVRAKRRALMLAAGLSALGLGALAELAAVLLS